MDGASVIPRYTKERALYFKSSFLLKWNKLQKWKMYQQNNKTWV